MSGQNRQRAYLVLADGTVFEGYAMGAAGVTVGEVVFNTCTASYQELLSDPTYYGQIVAQTYPLVGNRGVGQEDAHIMANGYIVREWCDAPTDTHGGVTLDAYLRQRGIVGICGVDTRRLTRVLRDKGYFNGAITDTLADKDALLEKIRAYTISGAVEAVTIREAQHIPCERPRFRVTVLDYGFPRAMLHSLTRRGCELTIVPAATPAERILADRPDGIVYSDGPGDPDDNPALVETIRTLLTAGRPALGIGLGHQMMALAVGGRIVKMAKGHRGSNQPVRICADGRIVVTTQNHGYDVEQGSVSPDVAAVSMVNVNDGSIEGLAYHTFPGLSVQFTPTEALGGYPETDFVFDAFLAQMEGDGRHE